MRTRVRLTSSLAALETRIPRIGGGPWAPRPPHPGQLDARSLAGARRSAQWARRRVRTRGRHASLQTKSLKCARSGLGARATCAAPRFWTLARGSPIAAAATCGQMCHLLLCGRAASFGSCVRTAHELLRLDSNASAITVTTGNSFSRAILRGTRVVSNTVSCLFAKLLIVRLWDIVRQERGVCTVAPECLNWCCWLIVISAGDRYWSRSFHSISPQHNTTVLYSAQ